MDKSLILQQCKAHLFPISLGVLGLFFIGYGFVSSHVLKVEKEAITFESASQQSLPREKSLSQETITVDIEGGVLKPGVYKLAKNSRIQEAVLAAGGMSEFANRVQVAKMLNLAAKLTDGGKIYIPIRGEAEIVSGSTVLGAQTGTINLNTATTKELDSLPGVGEVTAQKIISNRPYSEAQDLIQKKVVSPKVFGQIKEKITVY